MQMKLGLCLTGGGAKGAFQGGIIKGLYEKNIIPEVITGTSIGAVNLYFMINGCCRELESYWNDVQMDIHMIKPGIVVDNSLIINKLYDISGSDERIDASYVNYVHVENGNLSEIVVDIRKLPKREVLDAVKYSSLLPSRPDDFFNYNVNGNNFDSSKTFMNFREDLESGIYEGFNLDGGILNNNLLMPLVNEGVDRIIIIALRDDYTPPDYIYDYYKKSDVIIYKPDFRIQPMDTLRFEKKFCRDLYSRGYELFCKTSNMIFK